MASLYFGIRPWARSGLLDASLSVSTQNWLAIVNHRIHSYFYSKSSAEFEGQFKGPKTRLGNIGRALKNLVSFKNRGSFGYAVYTPTVWATFDNKGRYASLWSGLVGSDDQEVLDGGPERPFNLDDDLEFPFTDVNVNRILDSIDAVVTIADEYDQFSVVLRVNAIDNREVRVGYALPTRLPGQSIREFARDLFTIEGDRFGGSVSVLGFFASYTNIGAICEQERSEYRIRVRLAGGNVN